MTICVYLSKYNLQKFCNFYTGDFNMNMNRDIFFMLFTLIQYDKIKDIFNKNICLQFISITVIIFF